MSLIVGNWKMNGLAAALQEIAAMAAAGVPVWIAPPFTLIDRARASAGLAQWGKAKDDLTLALSQRPSEHLILRLRAETHLQLADYDAAERDANQALVLAPREVENHLIRGRVKEAKRLGRVPD